MTKRDMANQVFAMKCKCLPKEDRGIYKKLLKKVYRAKKDSK